MIFHLDGQVCLEHSNVRVASDGQPPLVVGNSHQVDRLRDATASVEYSGDVPL